jgi:purine catabolism regulator
VGKRDPLGQFDRLVASHALSLLALELNKVRSVADTERRLRGDFLDALVTGGLEGPQAEHGLRRFGFDADAEVVVAGMSSVRPLDELVAATEDVLARGGGGFLSAPRDRDLYLLLPANGEGWQERLQREVSQRLGAEVTVGAGTMVAPAEAGRSFREAGYALQVCRMDGRTVADFHSLGTYRLLLSMHEPDALRAFADSVLGPLDRYDVEQGGELLPSLRAFLEHNARWETASSALFVHRHTLRYRMRKVEELTGRDLSSAHDRTEFWLALRARDLLAG